MYATDTSVSSEKLHASIIQMLSSQLEKAKGKQKLLLNENETLNNKYSIIIKQLTDSRDIINTLLPSNEQKYKEHQQDNHESSVSIYPQTPISKTVLSENTEDQIYESTSTIETPDLFKKHKY